MDTLKRDTLKKGIKVEIIGGGLALRGKTAKVRKHCSFKGMVVIRMMKTRNEWTIPDRWVRRINV